MSFLALFLILTGLPWAQGWGNYLKEVRTLTHTADGTPDQVFGELKSDRFRQFVSGLHA